MKINFTKGDTYEVKLVLKNYTGTIDKMWLTVKDSYENRVIQKTLGDGITKQGDGSYIVRFEPEDTNNLNYDVFEYDIQVQIGSIKKTIIVDYMLLKQEITEAGDE